MTWEYATEYNKLLEKLDTDNRPWRPASLIPTDGTKVYIKCGSALCSTYYKGDTLYDVGYWVDYTNTCYYQLCFEAGENPCKGEFDTEFGNCMEITGWKLFEEKA